MPAHFLLPPLLNNHMRRDLTPEDLQLVLDYGLQNLNRGPDGDNKIDGQLVLVHGTSNYLVAWFKVDKTTIQFIWNRMLESYYNGDIDVFASPSRKFLFRHPLKYNREEIITAIEDIPYCKRSTCYRKLAAAFALPKSTVFDDRRDVLRPHSSVLKPKLSEEGKISRFM